MTLLLMKCIPQPLPIALPLTLPLIAIALSPSISHAQTVEPMDFLDQPEGIINCVSSGTSNAVPWDHRFTYWLSGVAQFDAQGNMLPVPTSRSNDWLLTITNSRFPTPESHRLSALTGRSPGLSFSFPAVSQAEWETIGENATARYTTAFSYEEATYGLYAAIRNTQNSETARQMFQVIHYLADDVALISEAAPCFVGPRPPSDLDFSRPLEGTEPQSSDELEFDPVELPDQPISVE